MGDQPDRAPGPGLPPPPPPASHLPAPSPGSAPPPPPPAGPPATTSPRAAAASEPETPEALARAARGDRDGHVWIFVLDSSLRAQEALLASLRLVSRGQLKLADAAIVTRARGRVRVIQTKDMTTSQGAMAGAWIGLFAGLFFGQGGPITGALLGAVIGALFARLRDIGIVDAPMKRFGEQLVDAEAALFLLVDDCHRVRALHEVSRFPGRLFASTADAELVEAVRGRLAADPWGGV